MVVRTWIGGIGNFYDPLAWDPGGVPQPGDTAVIQRLSFSTTPATSRLAWQILDHVDIELRGFALPISAPVPTLILDHAALGPHTNVDAVHGGPRPGPPSSAIQVEGFGLTAGTISVGFPQFDFESANLSVNLADHSVLVNTGLIRGEIICRIDFSGADGSLLINDGEITGSGSVITVGVPVVGRGSITAAASVDKPSSGFFRKTDLTFAQAVGPGETVVLDGANLLLQKPLQFLGMIEDLSVGPPAASGNDFNSTITLVNQHATSESFDHGILTVRDGNDVVAHLRFAGALDSSDFVLTNSGQGAVITVQASGHGGQQPDPLGSGQLSMWDNGAERVASLLGVPADS